MQASQSLLVNEIYASVQGESTYAGLLCVFVRLTACNLRCHYCDTKYAFYQGKEWTFNEIKTTVARLSAGFKPRLVEFTGGEPLGQPAVLAIMRDFCDEDYTVLLETNGSLSLKEVDQRVIKIMDFKTPSSGMEQANLYENIAYLTPQDEIKFVLGTVEDYLWAKELIHKYDLTAKAKVLMGTVFNQQKSLAETYTFTPKDLAAKLLEDRLPVRLQLQLHKYIWDPRKRGV